MIWEKAPRIPLAIDFVKVKLERGVYSRRTSNRETLQKRYDVPPTIIPRTIAPKNEWNGPCKGNPAEGRIKSAVIPSKSGITAPTNRLNGSRNGRIAKTTEAIPK